MRTFTDNAGRDWQVAVNVDAIKRVKGLLDVDLMEAVNAELLGRLADDPVLLCDVIYCVCKPQADERSVSDEDFGRAMAGDAIDAATTALLEDLVDFFPKRRRELLGKALMKLRALENRAFEAAAARLDSGELERRMEAELAKADDELATHGEPSTDSPVWPESTPAR